MNTLSFSANGFTGNTGVGVAILHVKMPVLFDKTSVITIPFVLLVVLIVTGLSGSPTGASITFTDKILFSSNTDSKNPLSICNPVSVLTMITLGGSTKSEPPFTTLTSLIVDEFIIFTLDAIKLSGLNVLSEEYSYPSFKTLILSILPTSLDLVLIIAPTPKELEPTPINFGSFL